MSEEDEMSLLTYTHHTLYTVQIVSAQLCNKAKDTQGAFQLEIN